jgi:hypothetical protein
LDDPKVLDDFVIGLGLQLVSNFAFRMVGSSTIDNPSTGDAGTAMAAIFISIAINLVLSIVLVRHFAVRYNEQIAMYGQFQNGTSPS